MAPLFIRFNIILVKFCRRVYYLTTDNRNNRKKGIQIEKRLLKNARRSIMKKTAFTFLVLTLAALLILPLPGVAIGGPHGGPHGGHGGGYGGWWVPWAIIGGFVALASYLQAYYNAPPPVAAGEKPPAIVEQPLPPLTSEKLFVYPRENQSEELQAKDRSECQSWAAGQTGYDPTKPPAGSMPPGQWIQMQVDYLRAQSACLEGRGYTVR